MSIPLLTLAAVAFAQPPPDVSLTLAAERTTYRLGEPVAIALRFQSRAPGQYRIWTAETERYVRFSKHDSLAVEPAEAIRDPLGDIPAQHDGGMFEGVLPVAAPLGSSPVIVNRYVNEFASFRRPGTYRVTALSDRVQGASLRSNPVEIRIVAPEPGWAGAQVRRAVAVLERGNPEDAVARAGRTLRFLETREAARALARFFEHGPPAAQRDLRAGLFGSPYRSEVMAAMDRAVADPEVAVTYYYIATLAELAMATRMGPSPLWPEQQQAHFAWLRRARPVEAEYGDKLAAAVRRKQGRAREVSLETLERIRRELKPRSQN